MTTAIATAAICHLGDPRAVLLGGPTNAVRPESLEHHEARLGPLGPVDRDIAQRELEASGLSGRGGAGFSTTIKIAAAQRATTRARLIVNASESEPASKKDATIATLRPHIVFDGMIVLATLLGVDEATVVAHRGAPLVSSLRHAWNQRRGELDAVAVIETTGGYVAGESSAVASAALGGDAVPRATTAPLAVSGLDGVATVVVNVETVAHLGLIYRLGGERWAALGGDGDRGPRLATIVDGDRGRHCVVEVHGEVTVAALLEEVGVAAVSSVLIGGYAGTWLDGTASSATWSTRGLAELGAGLGCGLVIGLTRACGWCSATMVTQYLASQSAGQCGPCLYGLDSIASSTARLSKSLRPRAIVDSINEVAFQTRGRGGCSHPDAVIDMVASALSTFDPAGSARSAHRRCERAVLATGTPR